MSTNSTNSTHSPAQYASPPITIVLTLIILLVFFVGFFSIYFCKCFVANIFHAWNLQRTPSGRFVGSSSPSSNQGLDPSLVQSFPAFPYSSVKGLRREKYGLECAICLCEFEDNNLLRLLTVCYHVFHQECVDLWLESHKTCPVCRRDLDSPQKTLGKSPMLVHNNDINAFSNGSHGSSPDSISISIKEDDHEVFEDRGERSEQAGSISLEQNHQRSKKIAKFSRSHSTGHSIIRSREDEDRYTLRLPEHLKARIIRGHYWTSCTTFGNFSSPTDTSNRGFGEISGCSAVEINKE